MNDRKKEGPTEYLKKLDFPESNQADIGHIFPSLCPFFQKMLMKKMSAFKCLMGLALLYFCYSYMTWLLCAAFGYFCRPEKQIQRVLSFFKSFFWRPWTSEAQKTETVWIRLD